MKQYLLTVHSQHKNNGNNYLTNEVSDVSPELWLVRNSRNGPDYITVITNCIEIEDGNQQALREIGAAFNEIKLPNIGY